MFCTLQKLFFISNLFDFLLLTTCLGYLLPPSNSVTKQQTASVLAVFIYCVYSTVCLPDFHAALKIAMHLGATIGRLGSEIPTPAGIKRGVDPLPPSQGRLSRVSSGEGIPSCWFDSSGKFILWSVKNSRHEWFFNGLISLHQQVNFLIS